MNEFLHAWERLSHRVLSVEQSRSVDRLAIEKYGMDSLVLMENAAIGCVAWLRERFATPQLTTILCGRGNNGGDGLAMARHLTNCGWPCRVVLYGPASELSKDAQSNYRILTTAAGTAVVQLAESFPAALEQAIAESSIIVDALLGTGSRGSPREPLDQWIETANRVPAFRVAVDIPTGVDAETGATGASYFHAAATLTFVSKKPAMEDPAVASMFGEIVVLPIGIPAQMMLEILRWPNSAQSPGASLGENTGNRASA